MTRIRHSIPTLLVLLSMGAVGACNPEGPTGPKSFSLFDVYGIWKVRMDTPDCGPAEEFFLDFGPFGIEPTQDSVRISGTWYLDEKNPDTPGLTGYIYRDSGLAYFRLDDFDTKVIEGIFVSNKNFAGAYRELGGCVNRLRGKFLE
jgi:hypothetical protein